MRVKAGGGSGSRDRGRWDGVGGHHTGCSVFQISPSLSLSGNSSKSRQETASFFFLWSHCEACGILVP